MNRALTLKWFAVLGLASLFYLLAPRDVSPQMPLYLGMTSAAVIIWTFDLLPAVAVAAALTFLYLLTNMAPPEVVLGPWTTVLIWTTFGAAIFGEAMEKTGLAKRVALRCMLLTGGTFTGMLIGFAIGGIILGLLLASGFARTVIFCAIAVGIIRALDIDPKSRLSSIIVIACFFAAAAPTMQFLHTSESFIWSFQVLMKAIGGNVDWWEYLNHACFINTIYVALSFLTIYFMRGKVQLPEGGKLKLILEERLAEMGPMTVSEKRLLVLAILDGVGQIAQVELQLLAAVRALDLAGLQNALVEEDLLLAAGAGRGEAVLGLIVLVIVLFILVLVVHLVDGLLDIGQVVAHGVQTVFSDMSSSTSMMAAMSLPSLDSVSRARPSARPFR